MSELNTTITWPVLLADLGATNARFALLDRDGGERSAVLRCADHSSPEAAARAFLQTAGAGAGPTRGAFAVAAPVVGDLVTFTNLPWRFSIRDLRRALGFDRLDVINDFAAIALGLPRLGVADRRQIGEGRAAAAAPMAVLGPGSGLGVAGLVPAGGGWTLVTGEGGHVTLAPANERESVVLSVLRQRIGHVSAERVLSGPGLVALYEALTLLEGGQPRPLSAAEVTAAALAGSSSSCVETLALFAAFLGTVAGNLALTLGARGGVYIAGGIVPRLGDFLDRSAFRHRFTDKGPQSGYLAPIPTYLITHPLPAFPGLRAHLEAPLP
jgi:glucokinase